MSTKTTIKRIALVAAVAAAFGGLSTVAANAADTGTYTATLTSGSTTLTNTGSAAASATGAVGTAVNFNVLVTGSVTSTASDVFTETPVITGTATTKGTQLTVAKLSPVVGTLVNTTETATTTTGVTVATVTTTAAATATTGYTFTPDVPGTYVLTFTTTVSAAGTGTAHAGSPAVFTYTATSNGPTAYVSGTGTSSNVSGSAASASDIADGAHFATVGIVAGHADTAYIITSSGVGSLYGTADLVDTTTASDGFTYNNGASTSGGFAYYANTSASSTGTVFAANGGDIASVAATSLVAGTQTITITPVNGTSTPSTVTITWGAAPVVNVGYTAAGSFISDGSAIPTSALQTSSSLSYPKAAVPLTGVTTGATIGVNLFDGSNTAITGVPLTVTVSGPGLISLVAGSHTGTPGTVRAASLTAAQMTDNHATIGVSADGTAGTSVITVATGLTTLFTKTVTFVGTVASIKIVSQNLFIAPATTAGGTLGSITSSDTGLTTATTAAVELEALDANGNPVTGLTISGKSADTSVIASAGVAEETSAMTAATIGANGPGYYLANVVSAPVGTSGASTTVTFRTLLSDGVTYVTSTPVTFSLGGAIAKEVLSTDASSYSSLAPVKLVLTATDSKGNPAYDQTVTTGLTSALVSTTQLGGAAFTATSFKTLNNGVSTLSGVYAPAVAGSFTISGTDTTSVAGEAVSVTAASAGGSADAQASAATDAANEATDAANAATDAANAAADAADAATSAAQDASAKADAALAAVNALSAKITVLAAQIAKIVKKLGA